MSKKPKRQRKNPTEIKQAAPDQPPCMPTSFKDRIIGLQGSNIKLVIQKVVMVMVMVIVIVIVIVIVRM